jgi:hypothetical protein
MANRRNQSRKNRKTSTRRNRTLRGGFLKKLFGMGKPAAPPAAPATPAAPAPSFENQVKKATNYVNAKMAAGQKPYSIYMNAKNDSSAPINSHLKEAFRRKGVQGVNGWA